MSQLDQQSFFNTDEYRSMKLRQYKELNDLLDKRNTKKQRVALATKHVDEFLALSHNWAVKEARKI